MFLIDKMSLINETSLTEKMPLIDIDETSLIEKMPLIDETVLTGKKLLNNQMSLACEISLIQL
jgi:hypothetical protein